MREGRARLCLLHRQEARSSKSEEKASEQAPFRIPERGLFRLLGKHKQRKMRARMRRDARDGVAYRYNKTLARRGYRLDDHNERCVEFLGRGEHAKGFQQA